MLPGLSWRDFVPAFAFLAMALGLQVRLTDVPYRPYTDVQALCLSLASAG